MDEFTSCAKGLSTAAEALFFAVVIQSLAVTTLLLMVMFVA